VASLKPLRDSGTQAGSPPILLPKEPTRLNMAPRNLFGIRVFFFGLKFSLSAKHNLIFLCHSMLSFDTLE
jgi:hypothetical protein